MDYFDILKRAFKVTWKYKALWVLGFFVGTSSGSFNYRSGAGNGSGSTGSTSFDAGFQRAFDSADRWATDHIATVIIIASIVALFLLVMSVLSIAAEGGLIHLVNEAEENRQVRLGDGWRTGFSRWGRTFMIGFVIAVPFLAILGFGAVLLVGSSLGVAGGDAAVVGGVTGLCCGLPILLLVFVVLAYVAGIVRSLALRYGILQDVTFGQAIARAWSDLTGKRGAVVFMLVMILPALAYNIAVGIVSLVLAVPAILLIASGNVITGVGMLVLLALLLIVPNSAYGTFHSSAWTIFFRRMNGLEKPLEIREPAPVRGDFLPVPPPPAPPTQPAPPAPQPPADV